MTYKVVFSATAGQEIREFLSYLSRYDEQTSKRFEAALSHVVESELAIIPNAYTWFWLTGSPYRGRLFSVSRRTAFWFVYTVDEDKSVVSVQRFWSASRNPAVFEI
jgi:Mn-containing catalase